MKTCSICGVPELELDKKLYVDCDRETRGFRGCLCGPCRSGLNSFAYSSEILLNAMRYLAKHETQTEGK